MERLERLVNLVAALLDARPPLTREQIRLRVGGYSEDTESFRRNFERDKELLRNMGIPLVVEPLDARLPDGPAGYKIPGERYRLPDPLLEDDELAALRLAASAVDVEGAWGRSAATGALWKLAAATSAATGAAAGPAPGAAVALPGGEQVAAIFGAVAGRQRLSFRYHGGARLVDPWRLSFRTGQWYLVGWDHSRQGSRTFRVDRLESPPEPVGDPGAFERPPPGSTAPPPAWQLGDDEEVWADLLVDADQAAWATTAAGAGARAEARDDGSVILHLSVTNRAAFLAFVLGFLDHARLLGPPALVDDLVEWLERLADGPTASARAAEVARTAEVPRTPKGGNRPVSKHGDRNDKPGGTATRGASPTKRAAASSGPPPVTLPVSGERPRPRGPDSSR